MTLRCSIVLVAVAVAGCAPATTASTHSPPPAVDPQPAPPEGPDGPTPEKSPPAPDCTTPWMVERAAASGWSVRGCAWVDLDADGSVEPLTRACSDDGHVALYLWEHPEGRWALQHDGWGHVGVCDGPLPERGAPRLSLHDTGPGHIEQRDVAALSGRLTVVEAWTDGEPERAALGPLGTPVP